MLSFKCVSGLLVSLLAGVAMASPNHYTPPSAEVRWNAGQRIENLYPSQLANDYLLQRLTKKTYWVSAYGYNALFYVGNDGVLVIDPLGDGAGAGLIAAIRSVTDKPITGLIYTHYHLDHIGDAVLFVKATEKQHVPLKIYASKSTADHIKHYGNKVPAPTEIIAEPLGKFTFEGQAIEMYTPKHGHTDDNSYIYIPSEKVIQYVDMINPDQMPYLNFAGVQDFNAYQENLSEILKLDWNVLNAGHGNIGTRDDVIFVIDYIKTLKQYINEARKDIKPGSFHDPKFNHVKARQEYVAAIIARVQPKLEKKYGQRYAFEQAAPSHIEMVLGTMELYGNSEQ